MTGSITSSAWRRCRCSRCGPNRPLKVLPQSVIDHTISGFKSGYVAYGGKPSHWWHFEALKRMLDRKEPDYKD